MIVKINIDLITEDYKNYMKIAKLVTEIQKQIRKINEIQNQILKLYEIQK